MTRNWTAKVGSNARKEFLVHVIPRILESAVKGDRHSEGDVAARRTNVEAGSNAIRDEIPGVLVHAIVMGHCCDHRSGLH